ncbi:MAG: lysophospholipid acyltransferase family protein [bacterium]
MRRPLEWFGIRLAQTLIPRLPLNSVLHLANLISALGYVFDRRGKKIAQANLRLMFGARMTPARERVIIRRSYRTLSRTLLNLFWLLRDTRERILAQVEFAPGALDLIRRHQPAVMLSAHLGNWELVAQGGVANGIPIMCVAKQIGTPAMTELLTRQRAAIGQEIISVEGAVRPLIRALKDGKSVGLLVDQHMGAAEGGIWCTFFGLPVSVSTTPATLSRKLEVPILFVWSRPLKGARYRIECSDLFLPDPAVSDPVRTQQLSDAISRVIRRHPSYWCLPYRRWRRIRPGDDPARYPFYAQPKRCAKPPA